MAQATDSLSQGSGSGSERFTDKLKEDSLERVRTTQRSAADQLEDVAAAIDRAGSELDESQPTLAHYAGQLATGVSGFATRIKEGSLDELTSDAQRFAKSNPALFLLGSVGLGVVLARFLKASAGQASTDAAQSSTSSTQSSGDGRTGAGSFPASSEDSGVFGEPRPAQSEPQRGESVQGSTADASGAGVASSGPATPPPFVRGT